MRGIEWFAVAYKSAQNVIQFQNEDQGKVIGKALFTYDHKGFRNTVNYTITIESKDGRFRYTFENFTHSSYNKSPSSTSYKDWNCGLLTDSNEAPKPHWGAWGSFTRSMWSAAKEESELHITVLAENLKEFMLNTNVEETNNDW